jgi:hypothetical protein
MSKRRCKLKLDDATIVVAYYKGAYGPTLRIDLQSVARLRDIRGFVEKLSSGALANFSLAELRPIVIEPPIKSVTLATRYDGPTTQPKFKLLSDESGSLAFDWAQNDREWARTVGLIDGLLQVGARGRAAHQYLSDESDHVLVELTLNE